jgi:hypothetical protein
MTLPGVGAALGTDGKALVVLPDGEKENITPTVAAPYYFFRITAMKHGLSLVSPSGIPTNAPSDPDRLVYSPDQPGVLTVQFRATLTNNGPAWAITNDVRFEADDIAGSVKSWDASNPGGRPVAAGSDLVATLYYTNLPPSNSAFGLKMGRLKLKAEVVDEKCFWVFYPADAFNYPGGPSRPPDLEDPDQLPAAYHIPPNYFYYYMQTTARAGSPLYEWRGSMTTAPWAASGPPYTSYVEAARERTGKTVRYGANATNTYNYIGLFGWACRHELTHSSNYAAWWPNGWNSNDDPDQDALPSAFELQAGSNPTNSVSFPVPDRMFAGSWNDDEWYTLDHEPVWGNEWAKNEDWAYPGYWFR